MSKVFKSSIFHPIFYLFVLLCKENTHSFVGHAGEARRTGLATEARGSVDALDSREAGLKLTLQVEKKKKKRRTVSAVEVAKCMRFSPGIVDESFLGLMTLWLMQKRECRRGESSEKGSVQTRRDRRARAHTDTHAHTPFYS